MRKILNMNLFQSGKGPCVAELHFLSLKLNCDPFLLKQIFSQR